MSTPPLYWQKTSMPKRKIQKTPIVCQYQAVQSTTTCRNSTRRRKMSANIAARQRQHADKQVESVGAGDQIEKVAAGVGGKEDALRDQLLPGNPLAGQKQSAQHDRCR